MRDKVVAITGASSGIGRACALRFASRGSNVVLAARREDKLKAVAREVEGSGVIAHTVVTDVSQPVECRRFIAETVNTFGRLDVLLNNAGISMRALFRDTEVDVLKKLMDVNFWGAVYCTKAALPYLIRSRGSIVGISSIAGYKGLPARTGYSASKFAMHGFLEALRIELLKEGVHVLVAAPGFTASNIRKTALNASGKAQGETPVDEQQVMQPEEVARHIYRAVVRRKRDLVLTRQGKLTVWLNKWWPGLLDRLVYKHFAQEKDSPLAPENQSTTG